jgi:glutamate dehydrogenase (NAD(P)+)
MNEKNSFLAELASLEEKFSALHPELELTVRDPEAGVEGYVVVWSTLAARDGPLGRCGKGGTRITPNLSLEEVGMLARIMTLKNSAAGLPLGGAKSGLRADPAQPGFEKKYRRFVRLVAPVLHERGGIFGGFGFDIGGKPEHALWACDELKSTRSFTGKSVEMGGTDYDREGIAGLGVVTAALALIEHDRAHVASVRAAVQGLGAMGAAVVRYYTEAGGSIAFVSDPRIGGTYELPETLGEDLRQHLILQRFDEAKAALKSLGCKPMPLDAILYQPVEALFPCAVQDVISEANADKILSRYVFEGANNPASEKARTVLFERGVKVVPDFIANPGGIIAAFVEMTSPISPEENARTRGKVTEAKRLTQEKIRANVLKMTQLVERFEIEPVKAGRAIALKNIFN